MKSLVLVNLSHVNMMISIWCSLRGVIHNWAKWHTLRMIQFDFMSWFSFDMNEWLKWVVHLWPIIFLSFVATAIHDWSHWSTEGSHVNLTISIYLRWDSWLNAITVDDSCAPFLQWRLRHNHCGAHHRILRCSLILIHKMDAHWHPTPHHLIACWILISISWARSLRMIHARLPWHKWMPTARALTVPAICHERPQAVTPQCVTVGKQPDRASSSSPSSSLPACVRLSAKTIRCRHLRSSAFMESWFSQTQCATHGPCYACVVPVCDC